MNSKLPNAKRINRRQLHRFPTTINGLTTASLPSSLRGKHKHKHKVDDLQSQSKLIQATEAKVERLTRSEEDYYHITQDGTIYYCLFFAATQRSQVCQIKKKFRIVAK